MSELSYRLFIDGSWVDSVGDEVLRVENPATEEIIGTVPQANVSDVDRAVRAARKAFDEGPWPTMKPRDRGAVMLRMVDALNRRRSELVDLNVIEAGCVRSQAEAMQINIPLEHFADTATRVIDEFPFETPMPVHVGRRGIGQGMIVREPYGVAGLISAYNFPFLLNISKVAPALAAGCTMVLKPSPYTPMEALILGEIAEEAGLPAGVLNIVTGDIAAGEALTTHPLVDVVSFTGSDAVGRKVYTQGADSLKKVVLELGGKSPNIVMPDADLDKVVANVISGCTTHAGQGCNLLTRTVVHESLHDELVTRVVTALEKVVVGDPNDAHTGMGPLISAVQRDKVEGLIARGVAQGAQVETGGGRPADLERGYFVQPTLFTGVTNDMDIARQEFFGPVGVVIPFKDEAQAIAIANDSPYGLNASVWSAEPTKALAIARQIRSGTVSINGGGGGASPHSAYGGYKQSGIGREWGTHGLSEYLETKSITWSVGKQ